MLCPRQLSPTRRGPRFRLPSARSCRIPALTLAYGATPPHGAGMPARLTSVRGRSAVHLAAGEALTVLYAADRPQELEPVAGQGSRRAAARVDRPVFSQP